VAQSLTLRLPLRVLRAFAVSYSAFSAVEAGQGVALESQKRLPSGGGGVVYSGGRLQQELRVSWTHNPILPLVFGLFVGVFSGLMGLGGGAVIIPILVLLFEFTQQKAHGTSLAMILSPTQIPAIWNYHRAHLIDWPLVLWVLPGMLAGSYFGSKIATSISQNALKCVFGFILIYVAAYTIFGVFGRQHLPRTLVLSGVLVAIAVVMFLAVQWYDGRAA
jgi:hypothetical protein